MSSNGGFVALNQARLDEQREVLREIVRQGHCPFCSENLFKYHKQPIIAETDNWLLTYNQWPYDHVRVHLLIICKHHITTPKELSNIPGASEELINLLAQAEVDQEIVSGAMLMRFGEMGFNGSSVNHLHVQIIEGDYNNPDAEKVRVKVSDPTHKKTP